MLSLVRNLYILQVISLTLLVILIWIIPLLPLTRAENYVECCTSDVNTTTDHEHDPPFCLRWLKVYKISLNLF